jgi:hypothetical protein
MEQVARNVRSSAIGDADSDVKTSGRDLPMARSFIEVPRRCAIWGPTAI